MVTDATTVQPGAPCRSLYELVRAFACRWAGRDLADDVTQEVFLRLLMYRSESLADTPRAIVIKTTYNVAMTLRNSLWRRSKLARTCAYIGEPVSKAAPDSNDSANWLDLELKGLTPRQLEAMLLTEIRGLSEDQAALAMQASRSSVGERRRTAIARLREAANSRRTSAGAA